MTRPVPQPDGESLADRLDRMSASSVLARPSGKRPKLRRIARRRGALSRFLAERDG